MEQIIIGVAVGVLAIAIIAVLAYFGIKVAKMDPEERKALLISYLAGLINKAEGQIGSGHGKEKLEQVERWFYEKAPFIYKLILKKFGKENLQELIEEALKQIKENFGK